MPSVLITGCSSGFGELAALDLARRGWTTWASMRTPSKGERLRLAADAESLPLHVIELDVTDEASVAAAVATATADAPLDAVVNNAGVEQLGAVETVADHEVRWQFETNVFGLMNVVRATVPPMRDRGSGVVVNVGSIAGYVGVPFSGLYAATKHAVGAITEALHLELARFGVRAVVVEPGRFPTELAANSRVAAAMDASPHHDRMPAFRDALDGLSPDGERGDPQLVVDAIVRALTDPACPVHLPVGADAELIASVRGQGTFEEFEAVMRTSLGWPVER